MVASEHYQRLKHLYSAASERAAEDVDLSYGYAAITGVIEGGSSGDVMNRVPHQRLLSDVASLAAGSVEKDGLLSLERFNLSVNNPDYRGPVTATAEVVVAEPPRYHVRSVLLDEEENTVAEALALFAPSGQDLPPDPSPEESDDPELSTSPPAPFMPIHVTPYGILCLN